jgi:hypothetical protein
MSSTQIEAQAPSGTVLAFRPRAPDAPLRPTPPAPGWVPDELGLLRAVLLAAAMTAGLSGLAIAVRAGAAPPSALPPRAAAPASAIAASGPPAERITRPRP